MSTPNFSQLEKQVIAATQGDIPITERPYLAIAERLGVTEKDVIETLDALTRRGVIRRFGATLKHQRSGFRANAMVAWCVDEARIDAVGTKMAAFRAVSHCYRRDPTREWPYNLYTMVHASDEAACREIAGEMAAATGETEYALLFSRKELKKISMQYFPDLLSTSPED
ncbi:Lrp/AsnC family transcriptional regulator [Desulfococcus sp.]|uniref:siroheme decarboxylase subunit beta n=1 Tax=Desulfococcus sp. TaxID=2025834 RepID=UPI003D0AFAA9